MKARCIGIASEIMEVDAEHTHRLCTVHDADHPALTGHRTQLLDRIQVTSAGHVTEGNGPGAGCHGRADSLDDLAGVGKGTRYEHLPHRDTLPCRTVEPGIPASRVLLGRDQYLVPGLELEPDGLLTLSVRASHKRNRSRLDLRISWRESDDDEPGSLRIEGPK